MFKKGFGLHPLGAWCANTRECLAMLMRRGAADSGTCAGHVEVLAAAITQVPARYRRRMLVRTGGAGATGKLITHLMSRAKGWNPGPRPIVRRTKPSRRQVKNLIA